MRAVRALVVGSWLLAAPTVQAQNTDVSLGIEALARRDVAAADASFGRALRSPIQSVRVAGYQWKARLAWKVFDDTAQASAHLRSALALTRDSATVLLERARFEASRGNHQEAINSAIAAMRGGGDGERRGEAARFAALAYAAAMNDIPTSRAQRATAAEVRDTLRERVRRFRGRVADAEALMRIGGRIGDAAAETEGMRSRVLLTGPADFAPTCSDDIGSWARETVAAVEAYYRRALRAPVRPGDLSRALRPLETRLWRSIGDGRPYTPAAFRAALRDRCGIVASIESVGGIDELHLARIAHVGPVASSRGAVLVELNTPISNGLDAWLLEGTVGRAAWASRDSIYVMRTSFAEAPFRLWLTLGDPASMPAEVFRIHRDSVGDIERAKRDSLGYFPGVAARLLRDGGKAILDSLYEQQSLTQMDRQMAFVGIVYRSLIQTSVQLHEGRHLADLRAGRPMSEASAEFRAKVHEVSRADRPKLAMTAILSPTIGDPTPHGRANRQVMVGLNRWIRRHGRSIPGYDSTQPALLQLPKLTNAQLRAAFASLSAD